MLNTPDDAERITAHGDERRPASWTQNRRRGAAIAVTAIVVVLIGAMSTIAGASGSQGQSAEVSAATAAVDAAEHAPTKIPVSAKFPHKPKRGEVVAWLVPGLSAATDLTVDIKAAATSIGWRIDAIGFDPTNPATVDPAVEQAVSQHVNYIVVLTEPSTLFAPGLADAKAHGIPVMEYGTSTEANASQRGIIGCFLCSGWANLTGAMLAKYVISDSQGHGGGAFIDVTEEPELHASAQAFAAYLNTHCSGCTGSVIPTSLAAVGAGTVGSQTVAYLQAHQSVHYVVLPTDGIADDLPSLLKTAGLAGRVRILAGSAPQPYLQDIAKGSMAAGLSYGDEPGLWTMMYDLAANSVGLSLPSETYTQFVLRTTSDIPKPVSEWAGPPNYKQQYEALEGLTSG